MTKVKFRLLLASMAFLLCACDSNDDMNIIEPTSNTDPRNIILPLGASRVSGNRPSHESYRFELWKDLVENEWTFDFIGTRTDLASYPTVNDTSFDIDHEGVSGRISGQILNDMDTVLNQAGIPDIVLFSSPGGNDFLQGLSYDQAMDNINAIIDKLQAANPNITIIIEQMAPPNSDLQPGVILLLFSVHQEISMIADQKSTDTSRVIAVDMFTGFTNEMLADELHYNETGAAFIAERYYNVLTTVLEP